MPARPSPAAMVSTGETPLPAMLNSVRRALVRRLALKAAELEHRVEDARLSDAGLAVLALLVLLAELRRCREARRDAARAPTGDGLTGCVPGERLRVDRPAAAVACRAVAGVSAVKRRLVAVARRGRAGYAPSRRVQGHRDAARIGPDIARLRAVAFGHGVAAAVGARAHPVEAHLASARAVVLPGPGRAAVLRLLAVALQLGRRADALAR